MQRAAAGISAAPANNAAGVGGASYCDAVGQLEQLDGRDNPALTRGSYDNRIVAHS